MNHFKRLEVARVGRICIICDYEKIISDLQKICIDRFSKTSRSLLEKNKLVLAEDLGDIKLYETLEQVLARDKIIILKVGKDEDSRIKH